MAHCLILDGVYHTTEDTTVFHPVRAPSVEQLHILLRQIIKRVMKLLTRRGYLIEEQGMVYLAETEAHTATTQIAVTVHAKERL